MTKQNVPIPTQIRAIEQLKSPFKEKLIAFLDYMEKNHEKMTPHETYRTAKRQKWLVENGKSWVKVSNHQLGLAADLHFAVFPHFPPSKSERWKKAHQIAKKFGIDNGQSLWGTDGNHFQDDGTPYTPFISQEINKQKKKQQMKLNSNLWHEFDEIIHEIEKLKQKVHEMNNIWRK